MCGITSKLDLPEFRALCTSHDIVCFSETKCDDIDVINIQSTFQEWGFVVHFLNRKKRKNKSGGIVLGVKEELNMQYKRVYTESEVILPIKINKHFFKSDRDIILSALYVPPYNSKYAKIEHFDEIENVILDLGQEDNYFLFCGDLNAHTGTRTDLCVLDDIICTISGIDEEIINTLDASTQMREFGIPLIRHSVDSCQDGGSYGSKLLKVCQNNSLMIFNGRIGEDNLVGKATTTQNSVIDYIIGSPFTANLVDSFKVCDYDPLFSDKHCALQLTINIPGDTTLGGNNPCNEKPKIHDGALPGKWITEQADKYLRNVDRDKIQWAIDHCESSSIDEVNEIIISILVKPAVQVFKKRKVNYVKESNNKSDVWFNKECHARRQDYHRAKHRCNKVRNNANKLDLVKKSKAYKVAIKKAKKTKRKTLVKKIRQAKTNNPKLYWKLLKGNKKEDS